jgi:outer membrane protein TolC
MKLRWKRSSRTSLGLLLFAGILPGQTTYRLTLADAIQKGLQENLSVLLANARTAESEGLQQREVAALMPHVSAQTYANFQNRNLRAFGLSNPLIPAVVGPFSNYDFRIYAQQNVLDLQSYRNWKASGISTDAVKMDERDARDLIVSAVAGLYLNAQSAAARVTAAKSRVTDAEALFRLASDRHDAGTATGVDVLRAQVELANEKQGLLEAQNNYQQALLLLTRNIGMSPGAPIDLAEPLHFQVLENTRPEDLLTKALEERADFLSLARQRDAAVEQQAANRARYYPKVSLNGNIGELGRSIGSVQTTGIIQGQIDFTIFDHDREGEAQQLAARLKRVDPQITDLRRGVDQEIRAALLNLESSAQQVKVADEGRGLAERELQLAQDRFAAGTANNIEVVTAQDQLARAQENYILAVSGHVNAKYGLARALGNTQKNILEFSTER